MADIIQNNFNKIVLLNEINKNNILATLISKESNILPVKDSKYNLGNELLRWNKICANEIRNNNIKIIGHDIKPSNNAKVGIYSNGNSNDSISFHSPYGGIYIKSGRNLYIESDILCKADIITLNTNLSLDMNISKYNISVNEKKGLTMKINKINLDVIENIYIKSKKDSITLDAKELILNIDKLVLKSRNKNLLIENIGDVILSNNTKNIINEIIKKNFSEISINNSNNSNNSNNTSPDFDTQLIVSKYSKYNGIQEALNYIYKLKNNEIFKNTVFKINVVNDKIYNENINILHPGIHICGYNNSKFKLNGSININFTYKLEDNYDYDILLNNIILNDNSCNIQYLIHINCKDININIKNSIFITNTRLLYVNGEDSKLIFKNNKIYLNDSIENNIYIVKLKKLIFIQNNLKIPNSYKRDNIVVNVGDEQSKIIIKDNKMCGLLYLNSKSIELINNKIKTYSIDEIKAKNIIKKINNEIILTKKD